MKRIALKAVKCLLIFIYTLASLVSLPKAESCTEPYVKCDTGSDASTFIAGEARTAARDVNVSSRFYELFFGSDEEKNNPLMLYPGGGVFGLLINEEGVTVTATSQSRVLRAGDRIVAVNGAPISSAKEVEEAVSSSGGKKLSLDIIRGGERICVTVTPRMEYGAYRLGVKLRSQTAGIGTVTFVDPDTLSFGGLGHGVTDGGSGEFVTIKHADALTVALGGCKRGECGSAGELTGVLKQDDVGDIVKNCESGVFGVLTSLPDYCTKPMPVGTREELIEGEAEIISTVKNGYREHYKIEIYDVDQSSVGSKSFKIRVTDPTLIALTGGIVRGMSGSPIIQNGKLVGAVTHVMVANPTEGYGIFIENMLNAAENQVQPKAA
ncbi:MAG: SpoIVB peptidase [Clostridia bacterium]|nr:SpoIVB peptidase [Clostridia bacterium]